MNKRFNLLRALAYVLVFLAIQGFASVVVMLVMTLMKGELSEQLTASQTVIMMILFAVLTMIVGQLSEVKTLDGAGVECRGGSGCHCPVDVLSGVAT